MRVRACACMYQFVCIGPRVYIRAAPTEFDAAVFTVRLHDGIDYTGDM